MLKFKSIGIYAMALIMSCTPIISVKAEDVSSLTKNPHQLIYNLKIKRKNKKDLKKELTLGYSHSIPNIFGGDSTSINTFRLGLRHSLGSIQDLEFLLGLNASTIIQGPGLYMVSGNLYGRYNFVPGKGDLNCYLQLGAGVATNDIYKDLNQYSIGQKEVFDLSLALGIKPKKENIGIEFFVEHQSWGDGIGLQRWAENDGKRRNAGRNAIGINLLYKF